MKILVVDDSPTMRDITSSTLRAADYEVIEAEHGEEGLKALACSSVDLIISDLNMYKMGGFEFVSRVRAMPQFEFTPVMFLTTEDSDDFKRVGREVGASGWMVKPFEPKELIKVVKRLAQ
jgi:two-component system, chemotaxis family, chemotaxis protein CheY